MKQINKFTSTEAVDAPAPATAAQAARTPVALDDSELEDLAHSANQECLSFGMSLTTFLRLAKTVRDRMLAVATRAQEDGAKDVVTVPSWALVELLREAKWLDGGHVFRGLCPEASQPDSRDDECECCRAIDAIDAVIAAKAE